MKKLLLIFFVLFFSNVFSQVWTQALNGRSVWSFGIDKQNRLYAGGLTSSNSRIWRSNDNGASWDTIYIGSGQTMWGFGFDTNGTYGNMYVANYSSGLLKSTNGGANFSVIDIFNFMNKNPQGVACSKNGNVFVTTAMGFFRSTNGGVSFDTALTGLNCLPVLVDRNNQNIIYVGVTSAAGTGIGFYRSTNGGATFSENLNPGKNCYNLCQRANGDLFQITTTSPYNVDKSTDQGLTWTTLGNAPNAMRGIIVDVWTHFFVGGNGGVFGTSSGASWGNFNFTTSTTPLIISGPFLLAGTSGASGGAYRTLLTWPDGVNEGTTLIKDFILYQNYPNPFNPTTKIIYELKKANFISLKIYDVKGNEIKEIANGFKTAGTHEINFSGENLASGYYFAKLTADGNSITKGMVLIK